MALTKTQFNLLTDLRLAAREQLKNQSLTGKELSTIGRSFSGLIGELSACEALGLQWCPSDGYDARGGEIRYQIKTRRRSVPQKAIKKGRTGKFGGDEYDFALLVELDYEFETKGIYKLPRDEVTRLQNKEGAGKGIHVAAFKKAAGDPIYPMNESSHKLERVKRQ